MEFYVALVFHACSRLESPCSHCGASACEQEVVQVGLFSKVALAQAAITARYEAELKPTRGTQGMAGRLTTDDPDNQWINDHLTWRLIPLTMNQMGALL